MTRGMQLINGCQALSLEQWRMLPPFVTLLVSNFSRVVM